MGIRDSHRKHLDELVVVSGDFTVKTEFVADWLHFGGFHPGGSQHLVAQHEGFVGIGLGSLFVATCRKEQKR